MAEPDPTLQDKASTDAVGMEANHKQGRESIVAIINDNRVRASSSVLSASSSPLSHTKWPVQLIVCSNARHGSGLKPLFGVNLKRFDKGSVRFLCAQLALGTWVA